MLNKYEVKLNLEPELQLGHVGCSCSFCKSKKSHQQRVRRFVFGKFPMSKEEVEKLRNELPSMKELEMRVRIIENKQKVYIEN